MPEMITLEQAQTNLAELIARLLPGKEIIITRNDQPIAELRPVSTAPQPRFGNCRGSLIILSEDDEHRNDFAEYMPGESYWIRTPFFGLCWATRALACQPLTTQHSKLAVTARGVT